MSFDLGGCSGELKTVVSGGAFHAGMPFMVGAQFGVCKFDPDIYSTGDGTGQTVVLRLEEVVMCDVAAETATDGQALYYNSGTAKLSIDPTVGPFVACAWGAYASPASGQALVRINESGSVDPAGAEVPNTRTISTTAPITGGGDLSANRTLAIAAATNAVDGYATSAHITTLEAVAAALAKLARGTVAIATGATNGTHAMGSGVWDAKPVTVTLQSATGAIAAALVQYRAVIAAGTLTVTLVDKDNVAVAAGSDLVLSFIADAN